MQSYIAVVNYVSKCVVLLAVIAAGCQPREQEVEDEVGEAPKAYTETVTSERGDSISFEMAGIPGGTFVMGSPKDEAGSKGDERPQHKVRVDPFYLCTTETTLELFVAYYEETVTAEGSDPPRGPSGEEIHAISGPTPVYGDVTMGYSKQNPAIAMTWHNAMTFCRWLSYKTGRRYRLPTEAEWEYACRAGTSSAFYFGDDAKQLGDFAWYATNSDSEPHEVGKKKPNEWGLYDMSGNVREWVHDFYSDEGYKDAAKERPTVNPQGPSGGKVHVARGGDYESSAEELRCGARAFEETWWRDGDPQIPKSKWWLPQMDIVGFRVARSVDPKDEGIGN